MYNFWLTFLWYNSCIVFRAIRLILCLCVIEWPEKQFVQICLLIHCQQKLGVHLKAITHYRSYFKWKFTDIIFILQIIRWKVNQLDKINRIDIFNIRRVTKCTFPLVCVCCHWLCDCCEYWWIRENILWCFHSSLMY